MSYKKIAFDARYIRDRYHGIGRFAFQLLKSMVSLAPDYEFVVYRGDNPDQRFNWGEIIDRSNVSLRKGPEPVYWPHEQLLWLIYLNRDVIDLFYSPYFPVPLLTKTPIIMTVHDMIFERYPHYMPIVWLKPYYKFMMILGLRKASKVITVSKSTAKDLEYFYKFSPSKLTVIREGVDNTFTPIGSPSRLKETLQKYELKLPFILSVGAHRPHKNFGRLLRAFSRMSYDFPHKLVLVGPPDERFKDEVQIEIEKLGLMSRVDQLFWIPEADLPTLYSLAEFVVLPSIIEGFGLPALEAMACGTPVIASENTSFPEILDGAGLLIDPYNLDQMENTMRLLLNDEEKRRQMIQTGLTRVREFSWDNAAKDVLLVFRETIG